MPFLRYQTPSRVRQTSSASILPPLVSMMTGLPPSRFAMPGPLVETGSKVARVCAVETLAELILGEGEGDGDGTIEGDGEGNVTNDGGAATGTTVLSTGIGVDGLRPLRTAAK